MNASWEIKKGSMVTRWAGDVDPLNVLPEYPRPQMVRKEWLNLNGLWDYAIRPVNQTGAEEYEGKILVPFPVESALSGVKKPLLPDEKLWYRRNFEVPGHWHGQRVLLHFGAVDWKTEVWINGSFAGEHTGGFYPFSFDVTDLLNGGVNKIVVSAWDPTDSGTQERGKQVLKPGTIFYTAASGIWQTVWLEPVPRSYIKSFKLLPDIDREELLIQAEAVVSNGQDVTLEAEAYDGNEMISAGGGEAGGNIALKIPAPRLWSPESPFLYDLKLRLAVGGETIDEIDSYFGMRKYSIERDKKGVKRLFLNNKPLFQNGPLDQGYWPDGLFTAPTDDALRYDVEITRQMGYNMTRKHIKVEPARWYYHCDRLGLIVWQDMPNGGSGMNLYYHVLVPFLNRSGTVKDNKYRVMGRSSEDSRNNFRKELKEMVDALYNIPSIGMWVIFNEAWGQFDAAEAYRWLREYDPSRYIDHASGWYDQGTGDLKSVHIYMRKLKMPRNKKDRVVIISEYGGYSLPVAGHIWRKGILFGYRRYRNAAELGKAYVSLINHQLKPLIAEGLAGAVFTQLNDVEIETNGLLTYDREFIKTDIETLRTLNTGLQEQEKSTL